MANTTNQYFFVCTLAALSALFVVRASSGPCFSEAPLFQHAQQPPPPAPPPLLMRVFVCNATDLISRVHKKCKPGWQGKSGYGIRAGRSGAPFFFQSKLPPPPPRRKHALPTYPLSKATSMQATTGEVGRGDCRGLMKPVKFYAGHPRSYLPSPMTQRDAVGPALGAVGACLGHSSKEKVCGAGSA